MNFVCNSFIIFIFLHSFLKIDGVLSIIECTVPLNIKLIMKTFRRKWRMLYTFTKRVPFLKPWLWNRRSLPGRKWRQSRPRWQPKFRQEPHSSRSLQSNNTWNSCSYKWRPSGKNHLKTLVIFRKVLQNWLRVQAKTCTVSKVRSENIFMSYLFLKFFFFSSLALMYEY